MECIYCKKKAIKYGKQSKLQRFHCPDCKKTFTKHSLTINPNAEMRRNALHLLLQGFTNQEVAQFLDKSVGTIVNWEKKYLRKLKEIAGRPGKINESPRYRRYDIEITKLKEHRKLRQRNKN